MDISTSEFERWWNSQPMVLRVLMDKTHCAYAFSAGGVAALELVITKIGGGASPSPASSGTDQNQT
jgi:hypothetical protein